MSVLRQLKIIKTIKQLAEDKFSKDIVVEQYGFGIIIVPRDLEELKEIIKEHLEKEKNLVFEYEKLEHWEREKEHVEQEKERELELEMEGY